MIKTQQFKLYFTVKRNITRLRFKSVHKSVKKHSRESKSLYDTEMVH